MIQDWYDTYRKNVDSAITEYFKKRYNGLANPHEKVFQEAIEYSVDIQSKRIHVILAMIIYEELMGLPSDVVLEYLIGIEFIHAYWITHNDLPYIENKITRNERPTVWKKYGESMATLSGDALQSMGIECIAQSKNAEIILEVTSAIGDMGIIRGQIRDTKSNTNLLSQKEIIQLYDEKSGKLFMTSLVIGANLAGINEHQTIEDLRWFGILLGRAFHLRDEILEFEKNEENHIHTKHSIISHIGIEKTKKLLQDLEYNLLESANIYKTPKFADIVTYIAERAK